ncbi:hypothetical protein [Novosphingobium sp.]|jgi:hypothetical protein|uniref:hypothetical protein n=1 Tax=Novosphingobium sp. TaxID=1874826 RepID=UPI002FE2B629
MASTATDDFLQGLSRGSSFDLSVTGARIVSPAAKFGEESRPAIELKCYWRPSLSDSLKREVIIGDQIHPPRLIEDPPEGVKPREDEVGWRLRNCPIMLWIEPVSSEWRSDLADRKDARDWVGQLTYYPPAEDFGDRWPTITGNVRLATSEFDLLRSRLLSSEKPKLDFVIGIEFPQPPEEGDFRSVYRWNGVDRLPITDASVLIKVADWAPESDTFREEQREFKNQVRELEMSIEPSTEHLETRAAINRLNELSSKLATPLWIAVGLLTVMLLRSFT